MAYKRSIDDGSGISKDEKKSLKRNNPVIHRDVGSSYSPNNSKSPLRINSDWPSGGVQSITTPSNIHKAPAQFLAEMLMINRHGTLPKYFWNNEQYKKSYAGFVMQIHVVMKNLGVGFKEIHNAIVKHELNTLSSSAKQMIMSEK